MPHHSAPGGQDISTFDHLGVIVDWIEHLGLPAKGGQRATGTPFNLCPAFSFILEPWIHLSNEFPLRGLTINSVARHHPAKTSMENY